MKEERKKNLVNRRMRDESPIPNVSPLPDNASNSMLPDITPKSSTLFPNRKTNHGLKVEGFEDQIESLENINDV